MGRGREHAGLRDPKFVRATELDNRSRSEVNVHYIYT